MNRWLYRGIKGLSALLALTAILLAVAWVQANSAAQRVYSISDPKLILPTDADALARGEHLFATRGCADCHGSDGRGKLVFDAGPVIRVVAANITPSALQARGYDADRIAAAIRHGVRADGRPLLFMPAGDWHELGDNDTGDLITYLQALPSIEHDPGRSTLRPLGGVLRLFGKFPAFPAELLDHAPRERGSPVPAVNVEFGRYVAQSCTGCHGPNLAGGQVMAPGTPPTANITPKGLGTWNERDFLLAMREGKRPDGSAIDPFMPWQVFAGMTDTELKALWIYLRTVPEA